MECHTRTCSLVKTAPVTTKQQIYDTVNVEEKPSSNDAFQRRLIVVALFGGEE